MNTERLLEVADKLEQVNPDNFSLMVYATKDFESAVINKETLKGKACAMGYLTVWHPECWRFQPDGLALYEPLLTADALIEGKWIPITNDLGEPMENVYLDWEGAEIWFDMTARDLYRLFHADAYYTDHYTNPTPRDVATRIREFIQNATRFN